MVIDSPLRRSSDVTEAARLFHAFSDPTRLAILLALRAGELRVTDLVTRVGTSQANISGHLACLKGCGLVIDRPEGRQVFYRLGPGDLDALLTSAETLLASTGHKVDLCRHPLMPMRKGSSS